MQLRLFLLLSLLVSNAFAAELPKLVQSKASQLSLYTDSPATEKVGYGNWNPYEDGELVVIKTFIKEGDIVVDAGAHKGEWSNLVLEHVSNNCLLYSFEPVPNFFNILVNEVDGKAHCYNLALGKNDTSASMFYYYEESEGCSSLFDRKVLSDIPVKHITVSVRSLDTFCSEHNIDHIDFLKIDTEGSEWDLLQGADGLITRHKIPMIQFEYGGTYPDANITLKQVYEYLVSKGYAIFRIAPDGLIHIPLWRQELEDNHLSNWLAVHLD